MPAIQKKKLEGPAFRLRPSTFGCGFAAADACLAVALVKAGEEAVRE